jgi:very-short-patch-repair endonuclease
MTSPVQELIARGGVARKTTMVEAGVSAYAIDAAVARGLLVRPRRGWVATPDADPYLVAAARAGVVLTCVTRARRLGLWVLAEDGPHVGAPPSASRLMFHNRNTTVHWSRPVQPRPADGLEDGILNTLLMVERCQPYEAALAVWESALNLQLVERAELARLPLTPSARRMLDAATPFADSGLETIFRTRLRWLRHPIRSQIWIHGHRVDFLIGERLVVQIDGGHHVGAQRSADVAHDAALMLLGFHVIRVTYTQVIERWPEVQDLITRAVAQGLHAGG